MGKLSKINQNTGVKTFGTGGDKLTASSTGSIKTAGSTGRLVKIRETQETPKTFGTKSTLYQPSNELVQLAYDSLRSGTIPATTQYGMVNLPTGSSSLRASMLSDFAQLSDDRKRERLEAERKQLTQPGRVYNKEVTAQNQARVQEIDQELSTLLPEKSGRLKSGLQSILSTGAAALPLIGDTFSQLNKNTEVRGESDELDQLLEVNRKIRALEGARKGEALDYIRSQDQWKELNQQRIELNQKLQDMMSVPVSSDSTGMQMMRQANQYREQALNGLEGVPRFLGETALSIGQNAALLPTAAINPAIPLVAMGTISAADKMYELNERGISPSEAITRGAISGGIEAATEKIPLDSLLSVMRTGGTTALRNILRQAGIEAGEESVSYVANYIADKAFKDPEAEFSLEELARSAAGGALSGGVFGTAGTGINIINDYASGQRPSFSEGMSTFQEQSQNSAAAQLAQEMAQERLDRISRPAQLSELWQAPSVETAQTEASLQESETVPSYREAQRLRPSAQNDMLQTEQEETAGRETRQAPSYREIQSQTAAEDRTPVQRQAAVTQESAAVDELISAFGENGQKAFRSVYQENSDLPASFREFSRAYNQGLSGASETAVEQGRHINTQAAYYAGQNDAAASLAREKRAAKFAPTAGEGSGLVYDDYVDGALDTETADKVNSVAKLLGVRVQFVDSVREGTANAQISGSDVLVEKNNPNPVMFLLGHEWTHRLQETAPVEYRKFRDLVADEVSGEARVILDQYRDAGETITYEAALDEAAANYAGRMIEDGAVLDDFIEKHRDNRTLLEKVRDAIRSIISRLTGAERRQAQTAEGKLTAALEASAKQASALQGKSADAVKAAWNDLVEQNSEKTRYSIKEYTDEEKKQHIKDAVSYFGRTYKWAETGYITTDGKRLDFSGRHEGGPGGYRTVDHRDIRDALDEDYGGEDYSGSMVQFMSEGNIRIMPESGGINLSVMPTKAQMDVLSDFISKQRGEVILDLDTPDGNTVSSTEYPRGTHSGKVLADIKAYFEDGTQPYVSDVARFRYSLKTDSQGRTLTEQQREYFKDSKVVDSDGRLIPVYHATWNDEFTVFDRERLGENTDFNASEDSLAASSHIGFWFNTADLTGKAGSRSEKVYLNLKNPYQAQDLDTLSNDIKEHSNGDSPSEMGESFFEYLRSSGYDGIVLEDTEFGGTSYVAFYPEQIKRTTNKNPTASSDIRNSIKGTENARELAKVQEENDLLRERVDYWKSQTKRSKQATTDKKSVSKAARALVREYSSTLEAADISNDLQSLYDAMASGQKNGTEYSYDDARKDAGEIASRLVESALEVNDELYRDYADLRQYLKATKLTISAADAADILNYNDLRKQNFGRVTVSKGQTNIDQVYQELSERWPDFFDDQQQTHPGDQLERIFDVLGEIYRVTEENPYSRYMDEAVAGATNEILETFFDLPQTKKTFADVQAAKLDAAKAKGKQQLQQQREQSDARLDRLREQNRERVQNAIQRERSVRDRQLQRLRDQYTARDAAGRERRNAKELRNRITRHASQLSQKLLSHSDKQHIPDALRKTVASVLDAINLESSYVIDPETGKRVKNGVGDPVKRTEAFRKLKDQYAKILADESSGMVIDPELFGDPLSGAEGNFDKVLNMKDVRLADMSSEQLQTVWNVLRAVERSVSTAGKVLSKTKYTETAGWANALARDTSTRRTKTTLLDKSLLQSLEDPYTFFSHYGDAGKAIYRMLRNAQDQQQRMTSQVTEEAQKIAGRKTVEQLEKTTKTFQTERGESLTLTIAQIMEIYELMKRPQAQDHLTQGGIIQPEIKSAKIKRGNEAILLTAKDLADIAASLTDEEVRMADRLQRLTNGLLAGWGNEASNQVFGYSKFTEDNYWPIRAAQEETHSKSENSDKNVRSIKNISLAKSTVPGAKNALNVGSIFDTFSSHAGDMIDYAAWLAAMEDANRLYNFKFQTTDSSSTRKTIKGLLDQYGGPGAQQYWRNLMDNIQNGISAPQDDSLTGLFTKSIGSFKGAAVGGNARVIIQQPTAFFRANAVLSPADLTRGIAGGVTKGNGWKKALEWSPIAMRKDAGGFDISSPRKMKELLFDSRDRLRRVNDMLSAPAGMADAVTWGRLWNACEWATAREHSELKPGSAAFYQQVNERFTDMIDQTQVVDGVLQRSNIMRSRNSIAQQATSFMGEPIKSLNMFLRSWDQMRYEQDPVKRGKAMKTVSRTAFALIATNVVNALAQSVVDGLRDDDKDKDYLERLFSAFTGLTGDEESAWDKAVALTMEGNVGSNINPINQVPFVKDILSLAQGYDVSRTDMEVAADLVRAAQTVSQNIDGKGPKTVAYAVKELVAAGAKIFGVPVSNLTRDIWGIVRTAAYETGNIPLQYEMEKAIYNLSSDKNYSRFIDTLYMAKKSGDDEVYQSIYNDMVKNGVPEEKIRTGMESRMKRDQGVESVNDLDQRYLTPTQEKTYQASIEKVTGTFVWRSASQEQKDALEDDLYELTTGSQAGQKIQEKIDAGSKSGVSETDYLLYMLALDIADSQNENPEKRNGSTDQSEAEAAINMIPGLTDEARAYLWQSTNKGWKEDNNPWK